MAVPKKRTSLSKKRIRKNIWKRKGYWAARKAFSLGKSISTGNSKRFLYHTKKKKPSLGFGTTKKKKTTSWVWYDKKKTTSWVWYDKKKKTKAWKNLNQYDSLNYHF
uniref:Large ribosomal subunit protein bL32c n=1 Tax=Corydalis adunca TaxID=1549776 RepID=A0A7U0KV29_9MAGN|nr:ribosomal protein L32 [Corydalis adunca]YP_010154044.1 ribosomal protein L32 [Corydalis adunca]QQW51866.1 ribosomal protein L32 [Corydalis adunca]QQW51877.1 ribosomal protein L32 [Corydalis adunca]